MQMYERRYLIVVLILAISGAAFAATEAKEHWRVRQWVRIWGVGTRDVDKEVDIETEQTSDGGALEQSLDASVEQTVEQDGGGGTSSGQDVDGKMSQSELGPGPKNKQSVKVEVDHRVFMRGGPGLDAKVEQSTTINTSQSQE